MTTTTVDVHLNHGDATIRVGTAYFSIRRQTVTTQFQYDAAYLQRPDAWAVSPDLALLTGQAVTAGLPGAFADSAPDRWGRNLIDKHHRAQSAAHAGPPPALTDVDYLLGVSDRTRHGALRFTRRDDHVFLGPGSTVPKLVELPTLLDHAHRAIDDDHAAIKALLDAGTGSLGGARPKASVTDGGTLMIAKFPHPGDRWNMMAWEATALDLAHECGIATPPHRLVHIGDAAVLLVERFDRRGDLRLPYISALTLVGGEDHAATDYLEVAEAIGEHGGRVRGDLHELFRRIALSIAINNVDDHLRNHGFLRTTTGWSLAPVFDVNPDPTAAERVTSVAGATARPESKDALIAHAEWFDLTTDAAARIAGEVDAGVASWRVVAERNGIGAPERKQFAAAFA